jgi:hypothetical protein
MALGKGMIAAIGAAGLGYGAKKSMDYGNTQFAAGMGAGALAFGGVAAGLGKRAMRKGGIRIAETMTRKEAARMSRKAVNNRALSIAAGGMGLFGGTSTYFQAQQGDYGSAAMSLGMTAAGVGVAGKLGMRSLRQIGDSRSLSKAAGVLAGLPGGSISRAGAARSGAGVSRAIPSGRRLR